MISDDQPAPAFKARLRAGLWLLLPVLMSAGLACLPALQSLDHQLHDVTTRLLPVSTPPADITLIDIDERSLHDIGPWPWPRPVLAQLAAQLRQRGARLQVWDIVLPDASPGDVSALQALRQPDTVLGQILVLDPAVHNPPKEGLLAPSDSAPDFCSQHTPVTGHLGLAAPLQGAQAGHLTATPDADGRLRRLPAIICHQGRHYPQLALAAAEATTPGQAWRHDSGRWPLGPRHWLERGPWRFALDERGQLHIPYRRPHHAWPAISASQVLDATASLPPLDGHIVLVGATALGIGDVVSTPYHPAAPGVSVHAELLAAGQAAAWPLTPPRGLPFLAALLALVAGIALLPLISPVRPLRHLRWVWPALTLVLVAPALLSILARTAGLWLPVAGPSAALLFCAMTLLFRQVQQQRQRTRQMARLLESFLPPALAHRIAAQAPGVQSLGQPCAGIMAGVRIVGLNRWVSHVDSLQALALIHAIHSTAQQCAAAHGGQMEHAQGSQIYLAWPEASPAHAAAALRCVAALHEQLGPLLRDNEQARHPLSFTAAVEAGTYLLGIVGGHSRRSTLLGPLTNEVQALLELCEELASPVLVGPQVAGLAPSAPLGALGQFLLSDQAHSITLHRLAL